MKCRGTHKETIGLGCNTEQEKRKLGLGINCKCYSTFLRETPQGQARVKRMTLSASKKFKKESAKKERETKRTKKIDLMTADKYRAKYVQPIINEIARLIDYGCPCVPTGTFEGKMNGGHYTSVGSNRTIALNLHNVHIQSFHSNVWNGGDDKKYQEGIKNIYGQPYLEFIDGLKSHRPIKLTKEELKVIKVKAEALRIDLKSNLKYSDPIQRITLRNMVNIHLGIYDNNYSVFAIRKLQKARGKIG